MGRVKITYKAGFTGHCDVISEMNRLENRRVGV